MPKLPKNARDWHEDLVKAAQLRYLYAQRLNKIDQSSWKTALSLLKASTDPVYIQQGGQNKGIVRGLPSKISDNIKQILIKIVNEEEPISRTEHNGITTSEEDVVESKYFRDRKYRDSAYALLAAMYGKTTRIGTWFYEQQIKECASNYTDHPIDYDYRTQKFGAWKAMDDLKYEYYF